MALMQKTNPSTAPKKKNLNNFYYLLGYFFGAGIWWNII
jgi:hypothetical protein